ncbi:MAG: hypothetical protein KY458_12820, partial [Actinobacteria bacterium]|nr:hypothetical protein [Actinomycetota bacterium]
AGILSFGFHARWYTPMSCPDVSVKVVDLANPAAPRVASTIPLAPGVISIDVAAIRVSTPAFTGDLAALALQACDARGGRAERGVAYYDVSNPASPQFLGRYQADADNVPTTAPPCDGTATSARCAASQHSVHLVQRPDGKVLSLSTEPGASASNFPSGDLRVVDVTDPRSPTQVGSFPAAGDQPSAGGGFNSNNGCRPFYAGHDAETSPDGTKALLGYLDEGVWAVDLADPAAPASLGRFEYPEERAVEAEASAVTWADVLGRQVGLASEEDWWAPTTRLRIDAPSSLAGSKFACEAMFTLFDPEDRAQIYRQPDRQVPGEIVYVGRACPARGTAEAPIAEDPLLADPAGKIALVDRNPVLQTDLPRPFCSIADRVKRVQDLGGRAMILAQTNPATPAAFSPDGVPEGLEIPSIMIDKGDADALRTALCPTYSGGAAGTCSGGQQVTGAMVDSPGEWGGLRALDLTNPAAPTERGVYRTPRSKVFPPADLGVYSVHHVVARGTRAYAAWYSDGVRVLDLTSATPTEIAAFVPPDRPDPTNTIPAKAYVVGVDTLPGHIVISDINSGLYVLEMPHGGYQMVASDGGIFSFGDAGFFGSTGDMRLNQPVVGMARTPSGAGYWLAAADGGIFSFGDAGFFGSTGDMRLNQPVVGMASTPTGKGYWLVARDGGIFAFGDAGFFGSTGDIPLTQPVVGMSAPPGGEGYRLVAADGGIFSFGDAPFLGSTGDIRLNQPVVGMATAPLGDGYWMVASDGGIFAFGSAGFFGSTGAIRLNQPVVGMAPTASGAGYWLVAADGGIFAFGNAPFLGSTGDIRLNQPVVGMAASS